MRGRGGDSQLDRKDEENNRLKQEGDQVEVLGRIQDQIEFEADQNVHVASDEERLPRWVLVHLKSREGLGGVSPIPSQRSQWFHPLKPGTHSRCILAE